MLHTNNFIFHLIHSLAFHFSLDLNNWRAFRRKTNSTNNPQKTTKPRTLEATTLTHSWHLGFSNGISSRSSSRCCGGSRCRRRCWIRSRTRSCVTWRRRPHRRSPTCLTTWRTSVTVGQRWTLSACSPRPSPNSGRGLFAV